MSGSTQPLPPTTVLADILLMRGVSGCLTPPLRLMTPDAPRTAGSAVTVRFEPGAPRSGGAFDEVYALLSSDLEGKVVVLAGASDVSGAVWGQILSAAAARCGAAAVLVAGAVRDRLELAAEALPVYAERELTTGAVGLARVDTVGAQVRIGDTVVGSGDTVVVDAAGAVSLPQARAVELLEDARLLAAAEAAVLGDLRRGRPLTDAYRHKREAVEALRTRRVSSVAGSVT